MFARYAYVVSNREFQKGTRMSKYAKMEGLVEFVFELREEGVKWDADGGIVTQVKENFPGYTTDSAIPLRNLYNAHKAKLDSGEAIRPTKGAINKARAAGLGWDNIAGRAGITVAKAKKLAGDNVYATGRVYLDQDGKVSTHKTDFSDRLKDDTDESAEETTEDTPEVDAADAVTEVVEAETTASEEVAAA
jgi:hypothetical protein